MLHYLEPRTDVPARDDWSTRLAFAGIRIGTEDRVVAVITAVAFIGTFFMPVTPGNAAAQVVLGGTLLMNLAWVLPRFALWRARRRGLLDGPWRRVRAEVAEKRGNDRADRLLLDGLVLRGAFGPAVDVVLQRQEVFVCGPDAEGRAVVRIAGSTSPYLAQVDHGSYQARERVERPLGRPGDEPRIREVLRQTRQSGIFAWPLMAMGPLIAGMLIAYSLAPPAPLGFVAAALWFPTVLLVPSMIEVRLRCRTIARAVASSQAWTPVPITLLPWRRGHHVAGIADLPGGQALVRFPRPWGDVVANVADTGTAWIVGTHKGVMVLGVPGTNQLNFAVVRPVATSDPMSWWRRYRQPDFSALPSEMVRAA
ncbi:hypothetical protein ACSHWB_38155 [Lentzea sp. HUAS TT2]|uniref:hypothetical protein n=1 Tax=Lentzea sp. HUAS TT2 TaxID=3447454 RepID=UPI003F7027F9